MRKTWALIGGGFSWGNTLRLYVLDRNPFGSGRGKTSKSIEGKRSKGSTGNLWLCYVCATCRQEGWRRNGGQRLQPKRLQLEIADTNNSFVDTKGTQTFLSSMETMQIYITTKPFSYHKTINYNKYLFHCKQWIKKYASKIVLCFNPLSF